MPSQTATVKDALYALQYGKERLVRHPSDRPGRMPYWTLEPSGARVPPSVAEEVRSKARLIAHHIPGDATISYTWPEAA